MKTRSASTLSSNAPHSVTPLRTRLSAAEVLELAECTPMPHDGASAAVTWPDSSKAIVQRSPGGSCNARLLVAYRCAREALEQRALAGDTTAPCLVH